MEKRNGKNSTSLATRARRDDLHESSGEEGNANHHGPARNKAKVVHGPAKGNVKAELGELAVERVEDALVRSLLLVLLLGVKGCNLGGCDRGTVQGDVVDGCGRCGLVGKVVRELHVEDAGRANSPGIADNGVGLTV